ncbi:DNA cytosine methyltransferase [Paracoccus sp. S4493]|uniref:DNA cytosine methyltransferase n=1 Tax=Paracoccus sp. S4493 TaxID=579490 RepID=UPI000A001C19|nr:DNA cytosine methyltransferase [Paracoccus sp. S4493]
MWPEYFATPTIKAVDLFCGVGGLTHGLSRGGIDVVAGYDIDAACRFAYERNNEAKFIECDVGELDAVDVRERLSGANVTLMAGCAPCQPFSTYSRTGRAEKAGTDWNLVAKFGELVQKVQPDLVTMENVPALKEHSVFKRFIASLEGYAVSWRIVQCAEIGIPQTRKRLVLLASRLSDVAPSISWTTRHKITVRETISSLPRLAAGEESLSDPLHVACTLSDLNMQRIKASKPGGTWRDWPEELRATCHRRSSGGTFPSVYGRMEWDQPAPTMTTQCFGYGNGRFGHPDQDRAISLREAAMLQTFPANYEFVPPGQPVRFSSLGRLIGNAVPVRLGERIAESFVTHVQEQHPVSG